ncbi:primosomal protein N' [Mangrovicoccus algicola]|uniref:Replication restart protein PriA n=1 Tax=Mangrovicoccus algicola TaxID=2771008 RepID=A0A8J6YW50_9RHOB|nr:primosomal protein N' [Mangrovicoccus algicola]MBE3636876.1 primosomal protein N' [Mangrovicoccus algicola]
MFPAGTRISVLTTQPLDRLLDYKAPEGGCRTGDFLEVPLGPRKILGVVWGEGDGTFEAAKLRAAYRVLDVPPMREEMQQFLVRAADYTLTPWPAMLRLAARAPGLSDPPSMKTLLLRGSETPSRMTDARARVLDALEAFDGQPVTLKELTDEAGVTASVVKGLVQQGVVAEIEAPRDTPYPALDPSLPGKALTGDQRAAAEHLAEAIRAGAYGTTLLKGVTGSGKTEVYLEAVAACLAAGRQALVLLPEIALTAEFLTRVEARFGAKPAEWHHGVTMTERRRCWRMVAEGGAQMVIGARSALFLPFRDLGLIVVDEEHDTSYKQEDGVLYNARDMAVLRASLCAAQVVLASATPSLESWSNAEAGKYRRLDLSSRFGPSVLPEMRAIDMRREELPATRWISPTLQRAAEARLQKGEQVLFFLNRRGYAPVTVCRACGDQIGCPDCDARLVEHRFQNRLVCHQCGLSIPTPKACPKCGAEDRLAPVGPGVERLAEEAQELFPEARLAVLSSDLFASARDLKARIEEIAAGDADLIIGTQLVSKGHNFPNLTLVGVIDADLGLKGSDLRAAERTFQQMRQVAGRAGRAEKPGLALLQSYEPDHPVIRAILSGDEEAFWRAEAEGRRMLAMPPYGRMAGIVLSSPDLAQAFGFGQALARGAGPLKEIGAEVYGPAPAPIARIRGRHRVRLLVKAGKTAPLQPALRAWLAQFRPPANLRLSVDIDPQSFF